MSAIRTGHGPGDWHDEGPSAAAPSKGYVGGSLPVGLSEKAQQRLWAKNHRDAAVESEKQRVRRARQRAERAA